MVTYFTILDYLATLPSAPSAPTRVVNAPSGVVAMSGPGNTVAVAQRARELSSDSYGKPLVSILIPAYNAGKSIGETIRSALAQTWEPKEIIVVDDGSTDQTAETVRMFESQGVRLISQRNKGAAAARNKAFAASHGDYIQWLDADDLLSPDKIALQMRAVKKIGRTRTLFSCPWGGFFYRTHPAKFAPSALWCDLSPTEFLFRKMGLNLFMQTSTWLVSRALTEAAGPWDTKLSLDDDGEYFCRVILASDGVRFIPDAKVYYRYTGTKGLNYVGRSNMKLDSLWRSMRLHIRYLRSLEESERVRAACVKYIQTNFIYFYPVRRDIVEQQNEIVKELKAQLQLPHLSWKFLWLKNLFGWRFATHAQLLLPHIKWSFLAGLDKALFCLESHSGTKLRGSSKELACIEEVKASPAENNH